MRCATLRPCERLSHARHALQGVIDLVCQIDSSDMHEVNPGNLYFLLDLIMQQIEIVEETMAG